MSGKVVLDSIERGVRRLLEDNRRLRMENGRLAARVERAKEENKRLAGELEEAKRRLTIKELAAGFAEETGGIRGMAGGDKKAAQGRINRLMREIDACIRLVSKDL